MKPIPVEATIEPDLYAAIRVLFLRVLQRDQTERPSFLVTQGHGSEWIAVVFIGDTPPPLAKHYQRQAVAVVASAPEEQGLDAMSRVGRGPTAERALAAIKTLLLDALVLRLKSDLGAYELVLGRPFPGATSQGIPCDPHAPPPDEESSRRRLGRGA